MARARACRGFTALKIEGGILPSEFLHAVATLEAPRQEGADYGLSKSLEIKEELARYWRIGNDLYGRYSERRPRQDLAASQVDVEEWLVPFLRSLLGYDDLADADSVVLEDRVFRLTHRACEGAVPLLLVTHDFDLDRADPRLGQDGRRQAPHGMMQEYLNAEDAALWGMVSNGSKLRILRDNPSLTRPSYIEADLDLVFAEELYPDFAALWLTAHSSRLRPLDDRASNCIIESWRATAQETGERVRENLRDGVTEALRQIGNGFLCHPANTGLREALETGALSSERYFQQLLRLIYRLLILFSAEERNLLHAPDATDEQRSLFADGYALSRLRERALRRRHYDRNRDLWQGLQITFGALATGAPGLGLSALGGLFRAGECPDLDGAAIANEHLLETVRNLAFFRSGNSLARVNYRDMDTEELGSVYESLLELRPVIDVDASPWAFAFIGDGNGERVKGSERKLTGSYYTPSSLVGELVKSTLDPVIAEAVRARPEDPCGAILDLKVVDPACGSGHFLLAAARRLADEIARVESGAETPDEGARQHALREVVRHCIYGVDQNPLAVELCKAALWMETVEPGKPLAFLDPHILQGDSP
ncbi:MAG: N-6 DNA methylase, partial [Boseongicola sp. SB0676_bin_33]|nr:N-6 DNA methylase [Boseongicola sp. SB0676_bin_33]